MKYNGHPDQALGHITFAQHADDLMILNLFKLIGVEKPTWLDLGAHHPRHLSNTCLLYLRGCRGVNVEANPLVMAEFQRERPEDVNVNVGVHTETGVKTFYMYGHNSGRNTFSLEETETVNKEQRVISTLTLPVLTVNELVTAYCNGRWPDLLNVDIEGLDYGVLESAKFDKTWPKIVVVETRKNQGERMHRLMNSKGYVSYCRMWENLFFVSKDVAHWVY